MQGDETQSRRPGGRLQGCSGRACPFAHSCAPEPRHGGRCCSARSFRSIDDRPAHAGALRRRRRAGAVSLAGCRAQRAGRRQGVEFNARVGGKQHADRGHRTRLRSCRFSPAWSFRSLRPPASRTPPLVPSLPSSFSFAASAVALPPSPPPSPPPSSPPPSPSPPRQPASPAPPASARLRKARLSRSARGRDQRPQLARSHSCARSALEGRPAPL